MLEFELNQARRCPVAILLRCTCLFENSIETGALIWYFTEPNFDR